MTQSPLAVPRCPECQAELTYSLGLNRWECAQHGPQWSGEALARVRGFER